MLHEAFRVRIPVFGPVVITRRLHLDALLHGVMVSLGMSEPGRVEDIPLKKTGPIFHGSAAFLYSHGDPVRSRRQNWRVQRWDTYSEFVTYGNDDVKKAQEIVSVLPGNKNNLSRHVLLFPDEVIFHGVGDIDAVNEILKEGLFGIGKRQWSNVRKNEIQVEQLNKDGSIVWESLPARTVPVDVWTELTGKSSADLPIEMESFFPPYWRTEKTACVVPPIRGRFFMEEDAA
ncbi:hypothetical protein [Leptospirillum ferriphilum]|uniref:hypothetical protein n=1 Tax=Leptospirillum ferriphilum TaxID=178606 RepID=UPI0006B1F178|nr:hypothetical protein [Leptospirillum ferriphilum]